MEKYIYSGKINLLVKLCIKEESFVQNNNEIEIVKEKEENNELVAQLLQGIEKLQDERNESENENILLKIEKEELENENALLKRFKLKIFIVYIFFISNIINILIILFYKFIKNHIMHINFYIKINIIFFI